ncbi:sulfite exporter TauE/SafE family protein [Paracoccus sp. DMF-8]|uniref:sulfite exporter TauE/SafE family protein n=1 Tax=Paracoccus sp. DMF-8 TaxID=3019445 RepID=UPI0023E8FAC2|nr:sulfite exporter TauE/SafE family protein [Paracoccus sp. DMF-8]MDF3606090.1 sulfite exporter TauE/SafE family protein [Paracoccus sp. DMF-8]
MSDLILLFVAGLVAGILNAVAGGGTFVTFPALVATGVPIVMANATATVAALPGYLSGTIGFRSDIAQTDRRLMLRLTWLTLIGGVIGSLLLLVSSNKVFAVLVPFLLLAATLIFVFSAPIRSWAARNRNLVVPFGAATMIPVAIYGGYFNGGLGIVLLALFSLWGMTDLHEMNGLKCWLSFALALIATAIFAVGGQIAWFPCLVMSVGSIIGGLVGPPIARRIPIPVLRALIAAIGFGMTALFFWRIIN